MLFAPAMRQTSEFYCYMYRSVGLVNRSKAMATIRFFDTVNRLTPHPTQYI